MSHLTLKRCGVGAAFSALLLTTSVTAQERKLHAHSHGESVLKIAQEGNQIAFELEAPGADVVGFERSPNTDDEAKAVQSALGQFKNAETVFMMPKEAGCTSELDEVDFETEGKHAEFHVKWKLTCTNVAAATTLSTTFFDLFKKAREVKIQAIGGAGQAVVEMKRGNTSVDLKSAIGR